MVGLYTKAKDYPERAREAILETHRQVGPLRFDKQGRARRGLLVRHLVMPGLVRENAAIFKWLAEEVSKDTYVNTMEQYRPEYQVAAGKDTHKYSDIARRSDAREFLEVRDTAVTAGLWRFDKR